MRDRTFTPVPSPAQRERGAEGGVWGHPTQGFRPGLLYSAPGGAPRNRRPRKLVIPWRLGKCAAPRGTKVG
ncbi:hypothetical protein SBA2_840003 [Acidobacteriia bacterium SbA2]|nr:hypothetical protein SBA2_840003 [Acidobacteriia bacterium SbA2]